MVDEHAAQESEAEGTEAHDADPHEDEELVGVQLDGESSSDDATLKFGKGDGEEDRIVTAEEASEKASLGHAEDNTDNSEAAYTNKELVQVSKRTSKIATIMSQQQCCSNDSLKNKNIHNKIHNKRIVITTTQNMNDRNQ